jgi:hypothetical protein
VQLPSNQKCKLIGSFPAVVNFDLYHFVSSQCSVTCGTGVSVRTVTCRSLDGKQVPDSSCSAVENKPASTQKCTKQSCEHELQVTVVIYPISSQHC